MVRYRRPIRTPHERAQAYQSARRIQSAIRRRLARLERRRRARAARMASYERRHPTIQPWYGPRGNVPTHNNPMASPPRPRGPNRLTTPTGILPGHPNQQRVDIYNQHIAAMRARQNQNPNWVGGRVRSTSQANPSAPITVSRGQMNLDELWAGVARTNNGRTMRLDLSNPFN